MTLREFFRQFFGAMIPILAPLLGSYLNCVAMRIEKDRDFLHGHSYCMTCGHELAFRDLIPVFSFLSTGGKCRYCKQKISIRYPITEILFAVIYIAVYIRFGLNIEMVRNLVLVGVLFTVSIVDIDSYIIPDKCLLTGLAAWIVAEPFITVSWRQSIGYVISGLICGGVMLLLSLILDAVLKKNSLGGGDIKLYALLGLYLGGWRSYFLVMLSCFIGLISIAIMKLMGSIRITGESEKLKRRENATGKGIQESGHFAFGPSIAAAGYIMLMFGNDIINWYFSFMR